MVGVLPGHGPINAVAMLVPVAFALGLPPESSLILMAAICVGSEYGGRISAILLNVPGEASAVMAAIEGYPLARQGQAGVALSLAAWTPFVGSAIATPRAASSAMATCGAWPRWKPQITARRTAISSPC
jgi:putative tricarboxylic transport membrane protein